MIVAGDKGAAVEALQMACNGYRYWRNVDRERTGTPPLEVKALRVDGKAGPLTVGVAKALLRDVGITIEPDDPIPAECVSTLDRAATENQQRVHSYKPHGAPTDRAGDGR